MSKEDLQSLHEQLMSLDPEEVKRPATSIAVALQEADTLRLMCETEETQTALQSVGIKADTLHLFAKSVGAAREAQTAWTLARNRRKSQDQIAQETKAVALRSQAFQTLRWNLRNDDTAMQRIETIREGSGSADLLMDLDALAAMVKQHSAQLDIDATFDQSAFLAEVQQLTQSLRNATSQRAGEQAQEQARDLRNRAWSLMHKLTIEIRQAGRYAFRHDPTMQKKFASQQRRTRRRNNTQEELA